MSAPSALHGISPSAPGINGLFYFGVASFMRALEGSYARPGMTTVGPLSSFDRHFRLAAENMLDTIWKIDRVAELLEASRQQFRLLDESTTQQQMVLSQNALKDVPIYLESLIIYLKIFADCLAKLTPYLYLQKKGTVCSESFRDQRKWFIKTRPAFDKEYGSILERHSRWFDVLAGKGGKNEHGLRDAIIHYGGGIQLMIRPSPLKLNPELVAHLYSSSSSVWAVFPTLQGVVKDLFYFLDLYLIHFNQLTATKLGTPVLDLGTSRAALLFEFEGNLPSSWLYPHLTATGERAAISQIEK